MHRPTSAFCFHSLAIPRLCICLSSRASLIHLTPPYIPYLTRHTPTTPANMENGNPSAPQGEGKDPSSFLSDIIGNAVTVKLNSGVVYKGELQSVDGYMNIALEKTEEYVNGTKRRSYGDAFVRGNNVMYISAD
ncbi:hypothetical protein BN1708_000725, partial [Verticillium longisporum]